MENPTTIQVRHNAVQTVITGMQVQAAKCRKQAQYLEGAAAVEADAANVARITRAAINALTNLVGTVEAQELGKRIGMGASNGHVSAVKTQLGR
jgi:hypothetical protein